MPRILSLAKQKNTPARLTPQCQEWTLTSLGRRPKIAGTRFKA